MTNYKKLSYGSSGEDVRQLQELLNQNGAQLDPDGIFGNQTQAAVKKYQQDNQLTVDGVAGDETWGSLTGSQSAAAPEVETAPETSVLPYSPSDSVLQAEQMLQQQLGTKPGSYTPVWQDQLDETTEAILGREDFQYDLNGDPLYQQLVDQYVGGGKMAMMDTMGQAAALTGGYGNSYAQTAGQQAYQEYLKGLNDKVPELYQLAMTRHQMEGDQLQEKLGVLQQREDADYGRWMDSVNAWMNERDYLAGRYDSERDYDYGKWADERDFDYQKDRDAEADRQWQAQFDEAKRQFELNYNKSSGGGGGGYYSGKEPEWGSGIDTTRGTGEGQLKGSAWDYTKNNLSTLLRTGQYPKAVSYMDQIVDEVNEEQYNELISVFNKYGYSMG